MSELPLSLHDHLHVVVAAVLGCERALLCTDFDGTLVPIDDDPARCLLDDGTRQVLAGLHRPPRLHVAVVSGRRLADVRQRVGIDGLFYAGNHGLEIEGGGLVFREPVASALRGAIASLAAELAAAIAGIEGAWLEPKGLTCTIHFRRVHPEAVAGLRDAVARTAARAVVAGLVQLRAGKGVIEVRPRVAWDKGSAFKRIGDACGCDPAGCLFIGDDDTDEDAFRAGRESITIRVGPSGAGSAARYIATVDDVMSLLLALHRGLVDESPAPS